MNIITNLAKNLTEKTTLNLLNWYLSKLDTKKKREEIVDSFLSSCPRKFSSKEEYQEIRNKLLSLPLNKWS